MFRSVILSLALCLLIVGCEKSEAERYNERRTQEQVAPVATEEPTIEPTPEPTETPRYRKLTAYSGSTKIASWNLQCPGDEECVEILDGQTSFKDSSGKIIWIWGGMSLIEEEQ